MSKKDDDDDDDKIETSASSGAAKITTSDLLNYIDGIIASQGRILVMTTNYPEKLDRALVRAGRVDRRWEYHLRKQRAASAIPCSSLIL